MRSFPAVRYGTSEEEEEEEGEGETARGVGGYVGSEGEVEDDARAWHRKQVEDAEEEARQQDAREGERRREGGGGMTAGTGVSDLRSRSNQSRRGRGVEGEMQDSQHLQWWGGEGAERVSESGGSVRYYSTFFRAGTEYAIGDCAVLLSPKVWTCVSWFSGLWACVFWFSSSSQAVRLITTIAVGLITLGLPWP